jgi:protoheme IX farnesyltransferase
MLMKPSLSIMVVFSSVISYLLAPKVVEYNWTMILLLFVGGMLVTGSANAINQVVEKDTDAQMKRTSTRPVAAGKLSVREGWAFAIITGIVGVWILGHYFNWMAAGLAAFSLFLYAFIYTPLKKVNSIAVLMGAVPGALPCLIGWVAGDDQFSLGGWILFAFQFFWQFPHFWAIAWVAHKDYSSVGFKLLPSTEGPTKFTAMQAIIYSVLLAPVTLLPFYTGMCNGNTWQGIVSFIMVMLANVFMIWRSVQLYRTMEVAAARRVMFGSYLYLPMILFALLLSKA